MTFIALFRCPRGHETKLYRQFFFAERVLTLDAVPCGHGNGVAPCGEPARLVRG